MCQAKEQQVEGLAVRGQGAFVPNIPSRTWSWGRRVEVGGQGIFLWHLGPTPKAPESLTESKTRVTQACPCEPRCEWGRLKAGAQSLH